MLFRLVTGLAIAAPIAAASAQPVVNVFAASRGGRIIDAQNFQSGNPSALIDGFSPGPNSYQVAGNLDPNTCAINVATATNSTATSIRIQGINLGASTFYAGAITRVQLFADTDDNGSFETSVLDAPIDFNYSSNADNALFGTNGLDFTIPFAPVTARRWGVIFTAHRGISGFNSLGALLSEVELNATQALPTSEDGLYEIADVGTGAAVLNATNVFVGAGVSVFDGRAGSTLAGNGTFTQVPTTVDVQTVSPATASAFRLRASRGAGSNSLTRFVLRADTNDDGSFETTVIDQPINPNFSAEPLNRGTATELDALVTFAPVTASAWQLSATPAGFVGVILREADLFGTLAPAADDCPADFNNDGSIGDIFDLFDFLAALDAGCP